MRTRREKLALDYTVAVIRTPVRVTDETVRPDEGALQRQARLVETPALLNAGQSRRFNAAFGIGAGPDSARNGVRAPGPPGRNPPLARIA